MSRSTKSLRRFIPLVIGVVLVAFMAVLPMLNLSLPGILPTPKATESKNGFPREAVKPSERWGS